MICLVCSYRCTRASVLFSSFFFFNATPTTEIYTLSLHDALPICGDPVSVIAQANRSTLPDAASQPLSSGPCRSRFGSDRKSTRLNSSHTVISYAVFCLKKKKKTKQIISHREAHLENTSMPEDANI